jgi:hypothetical protein
MEHLVMMKMLSVLEPQQNVHAKILIMMTMVLKVEERAS